MNTVTKYRFELDRSSKKVTCPACGQKRFVLYRDSETREYLAEHIGRCDRENQCGHHYTPKQYFEETGNPTEKKPFIEIEHKEPEQIDCLPFSYLERSTNSRFYDQNNLFLFLSRLFGKDIAISLFIKYLIG